MTKNPNVKQLNITMTAKDHTDLRLLKDCAETKKILNIPDRYIVSWEVFIIELAKEFKEKHKIKTVKHE